VDMDIIKYHNILEKGECKENYNKRKEKLVQADASTPHRRRWRGKRLGRNIRKNEAIVDCIHGMIHYNMIPSHLKDGTRHNGFLKFSTGDLLRLKIFKLHRDKRPPRIECSLVHAATQCDDGDFIQS